MLFGLVLQALKVCLIKICRIEPPDLLFLVSTSFYISRLHVSQIFETSFRIICKKKRFLSLTFFFNGFPQPPPSPPLHSLISQNPLSMMKVFCQCSLAKTFWEIIIPNYNKLGKTIPNYNTFWEIIIPKHNTIWGK